MRAIREPTQSDGWKIQGGRMTKTCGVRLCIPNLMRHFLVILPSWVFQPPCYVSSLMSDWGHVVSWVKTKNVNVAKPRRITDGTGLRSCREGQGSVPHMVTGHSLFSFSLPACWKTGIWKQSCSGEKKNIVAWNEAIFRSIVWLHHRLATAPLNSFLLFFLISLSWEIQTPDYDSMPQGPRAF